MRSHVHAISLGTQAERVCSPSTRRTRPVQKSARSTSRPPIRTTDESAHTRRLVFGRLRKLVNELDGVRLHLDAVAWDDVVQGDGVRSERAGEE